MPYAWPLYLVKYVRGVGVETEVVIQAGQTITYASDPVSLSIGVDFTDEDELVIYYPGQRRYRIRPSFVAISGGTATIEIPRVRLLHPDYLVDYADDTLRPDYIDDSYFLTTVDIVRNYLDVTTGANLVWHRRSGDPLDCCMPDVTVCAPDDPCGETLQLACGYVRDQRNGTVQLEPATYNGGWKHIDINSLRRKLLNYRRI